jgi:trans-aconitate 2-methyltransferase
MKGTALRPVFTRLAADRHEVFLAAYGAKLREAYGARSYGTILPFRRLFLVARRKFSS